MNTTTNTAPNPIIDKISITTNIANTDRRRGVLQAMYELPRDHKSGWLNTRHTGYRAAARIHPFRSDGDGQAFADDFMLVQAGPKKDGNAFLRFEWNPSRFDAEQTAHLFGQLEYGLDLPWFYFWQGTVTRIDVAVDLEGIQIGDYVFDRLKAPLRVAYYKKGQLQTVYLGKNAKGQARVYDKAAELKDPSRTRTRIEVAACPRCTGDELIHLPNPFMNIQVFDVLKAGLDLNPVDVRLLNMAAQARGIKPPLSMYPDAISKDREAKIRASVPKFWTPQLWWNCWPDLVRSILPMQDQPLSAYGPPDYYDLPGGPTPPAALQTTAVQC